MDIPRVGQRASVVGRSLLVVAAIAALITPEAGATERADPERTPGGLILYQCVPGICLYDLRSASYRVVALIDRARHDVYGMALAPDGRTAAFGVGGPTDLAPTAGVYTVALDAPRPRPRRRFGLSAVEDIFQNYVGMEVIAIDSEGNLLCEQQAKLILFRPDGSVMREILGARSYGSMLGYQYALTDDQQWLLTGQLDRGASDFSIISLRTGQRFLYSIDRHLAPFALLDRWRVLVQQFTVPYGENGAFIEGSRIAQEIGVYDLGSSSYQPLATSDSRRIALHKYMLASNLSRGYVVGYREEEELPSLLLNITDGAQMPIVLPELVPYHAVVLLITDSR